MRCNWDALIRLLPMWLRQPVDRLGKDKLTELRLRIGQTPQLVLHDRSLWLDRTVEQADLDLCMNVASQYSPWYAETVAKGFISTPGGHRLGICGNAVMTNGSCTGFRKVTSICLRVARDFPGIGSGIENIDDSILLIGPPGSGKTTLLRDIIRRISDFGTGCVVVIDERGELFPVDQSGFLFPTGRRTDVMTGCRKGEGLVSAIRCMGPACVAVDEVTDESDCRALIQALWCGVRVIATAHAFDMHDLKKRGVYRPLLECNIFEHVIILHQDKSWRLERMQHGI